MKNEYVVVRLLMVMTSVVVAVFVVFMQVDFLDANFNILHNYVTSHVDPVNG